MYMYVCMYVCVRMYVCVCMYVCVFITEEHWKRNTKHFWISPQKKKRMKKEYLNRNRWVIDNDNKQTKDAQLSISFNSSTRERHVGLKRNSLHDVII